MRDFLGRLALAAATLGLALSAPAAAQDRPIDGDLGHPAASPSAQPAQLPPAASPPVVTSPDPATAASQASADPAVAAAQGTTYKQDDLIGAAEGVFGKGAKGLADLIQDILKKQGEPNAYIVGREGGGAVGIGVRYGSGTLFHKVEGQRPAYWRGPSIGFDLGANAASTMILVYNLNDTQKLYGKAFAAGEGAAYAIGGFNVAYLRKGDIVLIPVRVGAGLRLGVNAGYMKFSEKQKWLPF
jgi:hypothetical protein